VPSARQVNGWARMLRPAQPAPDTASAW
jgi:hypothetical protein